jgi:MFS family permease
LSRKYGKRAIFLFSTLMALIGTAVGEASTNSSMLLACRIVQGFSISAFESLLVASVGLSFFLPG